MASLYEVLVYLYPTAKAGEDYTIQNDGAGDYIKEWNLSSPEPTSEQLIAAEPAADAAAAWDAYKAEAQTALNDTDDIVLRVVEAVALGLTTYTTADVVAFVNYRRELRAILTETQPAVIPTSLPTKPAYPAGT